MGTSVLPYRYRINGVVSTDKTVMQNMETLAGAAQSYITYDVNTGQWAVVINTTGTSIASFDDSNIIGGVQVQGTGLRELYNSVRVEFPHVDLNDEPDFVEIAIPAGDRNPNEPDNTLLIEFDCINDPVMAEMLGMIELKQSRVDRVITFSTDYSYIGLKAGDLIDVTNTMLGYTAKMFRIINISETDGDDGAIGIEIQALEYDATVYSTDDLYRYERTNENGIVTIGAIDPPTTPVITAYEQSVRPGIVIETTVPSGVVDGIEFWYSTDNTTFINIGTEVPATGGSFTFGDTVTFDYDKFDAAGNVYAKCRAVNATTASQYSNTASLLNFTPVQITNAINDNTEARDNSGNILNTLGLAGLMKLLDNLIANTGAANAGGIYSQVLSTYQNQTGKDLNQSTTSIEFSTTISNAVTITQLTAMANTSLSYNEYDIANVGDRNNQITQYANIGSGWDTLEAEVKTPTCLYDYDFLDQTGNTQTLSLIAQPAFVIEILYNTSNNLATANAVSSSTIDWNSNYNKLVYQNPASGHYWVALYIVPTYDLNMYWDTRGNIEPNKIYPYNFQDLGAGSSDTAINMRVINN